MSAWLALLDAPAGDLWATAGERVLAGWTESARRPHPLARRADPAVLDPAGPEALVSILWPDLDRLPLFDDPAVVRARRAARSLPRPRCVTTLTVDSRRWAGSLWAPATDGAIGDDPFWLLGQPMVLRVGPGLLGTAVALVGPAQERYAGAPWPSGAFAPAPAGAVARASASAWAARTRPRWLNACG